MLVDTTTISSLEVIQTTMNHRPSRTFTVYCVRHGEALHNVEEKAAKRRVLEECAARGLDASHPETKRLAEEARKQVLRDPAFFDATMTELGREEARRARSKIKEYVASGLPAPQQVITSPLQRCLTTVEEVFPEESDTDAAVHVRVEEDLRERLTGRPADNRMNSETLGELFPRFDFGQLRSLSSSNLGSLLMESERSNLCSLAESDVSDDQSILSRSASMDDGSVSSSSQRALHDTASSTMMNNGSCMNASVEIEDDTALRKRAFKFFKMLEDSESDSVAVVTHKGFLRGLERGCFGIAESPEFKNCEVRVYKIEMTPGNLFMDSIERLR